MGKIEKQRVVYSREVMEKALEDVKSGMPINKASRLHGVPRSSLHSKVTNKYRSNKPGPNPVLGEAEEEQIVKWVLRMASLGLPVTKDQVIDSVALMLKNSKKETPFINGRPGRHWCEGFLRRHPELSKRMSENVSALRASVTRKYIHEWFDEIEKYLDSEGLRDIPGSRVFNTDETGLLLNPKGGHVLAKKGSRNVYNLVDNNEKEQMTALVTGNAVGQLAPTMVLFKYKKVPPHIYAKMPKEFYVGAGEG